MDQFWLTDEQFAKIAPLRLCQVDANRGLAHRTVSPVSTLVIIEISRSGQ
jgi:hypothetical protein